MTTGTNGNISIDPNGTGNLTLGSADNTSTSISGNAMNIDAAGALAINSSAGAISIGNDDIDQAINIGTQGERTLNLGNATGATAINLISGSGNVNIASTGAITTIKGTTTSTSSNTGALIVDGGVGIAENLNVGGAIDVTDATTTRNNLGIYTGTETHPGGSAGVEHTVTNGNVTANSIIIITLTQSSSTPLFIKSTTNGSFIVSNTAFSPSATFNYLIIN